jgi:predicted deacylase
VSGSPANKIIQYAKSKGATQMIDAHSGGDLDSYEKGYVYINPYNDDKLNQKPRADNLHNLQGCTLVEGSNNGSIKTTAAKNGILCFTHEVERDKGNVSDWANVELGMIQNDLKFFKMFT